MILIIELHFNSTSYNFSAPIYALVLEKKDAILAWRTLMGPTNSIKARDEVPNR
jgi:nucleoside diphosphate kinase